MKIYLSYKYNNVSLEELNNTVMSLLNYLRTMGYDVFCNLERNDFYKNNNWSTKDIMNDCFSELKDVKCFIMFISPNELLGTSMLIELGYALKLDLPILLLIPQTFSNDTLEQMANLTIRYSSMNDLYQKLKSSE